MVKIKTKRVNPSRKKMKGSGQKTKRTKCRNKKRRTEKKRKYYAKGGNPEELNRLRSKLNEVMRVFNQHTHPASGRVKIEAPNPKIKGPLYTVEEEKRIKELPGLIEDLRKEIIRLSYDNEKEQIEIEQEEARKQKQAGNLKQYGEQLLNSLLEVVPEPVDGNWNSWNPPEGKIDKIVAIFDGDGILTDEQNHPNQVKKFREKVRSDLVKSNYSVTCVEIEITRYLFEWSGRDALNARGCGGTGETGEQCFNSIYKHTFLNRNFIGRKIKKGEEILSMPELLYLQAFYENRSPGNHIYDDFRKAIQTSIDEYTY